MFFSTRGAGKKLHLSSITNRQYDAHRDNVVVGSGVGSRSRSVRSAMCRRSASSACRCTEVVLSDPGALTATSSGTVVKGYIAGSTIKVYALSDALPVPASTKFKMVGDTTTNSFGVFNLPQMNIPVDAAMLLVVSTGGTDISSNKPAHEQKVLFDISSAPHPSVFTINATTTAIANGALYATDAVAFALSGGTVDTSGNQVVTESLTHLFKDRTAKFGLNTGLSGSVSTTDDYIVTDNVPLAYTSICVTSMINMVHAFDRTDAVRSSAEINTARVLTTWPQSSDGSHSNVDKTFFNAAASGDNATINAELSEKSGILVDLIRRKRQCKRHGDYRPVRFPHGDE